MQVKFTVYNSTTGDIIRWGVCRDSLLNNQAKTGEAAISGDCGDPATQKVDVTATPPGIVSK